MRAAGFAVPSGSNSPLPRPLTGEMCPRLALVRGCTSLEDHPVKINVRIAALAAALSLYGAASAGAQAQADTNKPGGLNKVAHDVSKTAKKAGRDTKAEVKRAGSKAHNT